MDFTDILKGLIQNESPSWKPMQKALDTDKQELIYSNAFVLYDKKEYKKAADLFTRLTFHKPHEARYWKGLAASEQMNGKYKRALYAWGIFSLVSNHEPMGHYHAAECYLALGQIEESKKALECAAFGLDKSHPLSLEIAKIKEEIAKDKKAHEDD